MGIFDQAKDMTKGHENETDQAIDAAGNFVDSKTGGKFAKQVDQAQTAADQHLGDPDAPAPGDPSGAPAAPQGEAPQA